MKCPTCGYDDLGTSDSAHFCRGLQSPGCPQRLPLNALDWVAVANERRPKLPQTTDWFAGTEQPEHIGWYERHFTDSLLITDLSMQWWDGQHWKTGPDGSVHWRQVGDYPAWRGLIEPQVPA